MKSSKFCKINLSDRSVTKYQRKIGITQEYYRSTPELEVLGVLEHYNCKSPKILEINDDFFIQEYIEGNLLDSIYEDNQPINKSDIDQIVDNIVLLTQVDSRNLNKYKKWNNNQEFLSFQISNTEQIWNEYKEKYSYLYEAIGISDDLFSYLKKLPQKIDRGRPLSLIHGDRHKSNMIKNRDKIYFIDWELSTIGDVSYDLAFHIHQMKYCKDDIEYLKYQLKIKLPPQFQSALPDIETYLKFITARSVIYYVKIVHDCSYKDSLFERFYFRIKTLCGYEELHIDLPDKKYLKNIIKRKDII